MIPTPAPDGLIAADLGSSSVGASEIAAGAVAGAEVSSTRPARRRELRCGRPDGRVFGHVQVGDVGYTCPLASMANGLMVQAGIRQSAAGQFRYKICSVSNAAISDSTRVYGVRLAR